MGTKYQPRVEKIERVWTPEAKLWVPHNNGEIAFAHPAFKGDYINTGKVILSHGLKVPTGDYTASLLHSAYCADAKTESEFKNVRDVMKDNWLWVFNRNLWVDKGVYVVQDDNALGRSQPLNIGDLEKSLKGGVEINEVRFSQDGKVRFAPKGSYNLAFNTPEAFAKDGFIVASAGKEGAEKLGEVSSKFSNKPYIYGLEIKEGQQSELRVSAVDGGVGVLRFCGDGWIDGDWGHAFGVL
jgi:hypothetical protein